MGEGGIKNLFFFMEKYAPCLCADGSDSVEEGGIDDAGERGEFPGQCPWLDSSLSVGLAELSPETRVWAAPPPPPLQWGRQNMQEDFYCLFLFPSEIGSRE